LTEERDYFEALEIGQPQADVLRVVVGQSLFRPPVTEKFDDIEFTSNPLTVGRDSRIFEVMWTGFARYQIAIESYPPFEDGEPIGDGPIFFELRNSRYLKHARDGLDWVEDIYGPLRHWTLPCLNHCIDVIGWRDPEIRALYDYKVRPR
jgi:hypothetical protein